MATEEALRRQSMTPDVAKAIGAQVRAAIDRLGAEIAERAECVRCLEALRCRLDDPGGSRGLLLGWTGGGDLEGCVAAVLDDGTPVRLEWNVRPDKTREVLLYRG